MADRYMPHTDKEIKEMLEVIGVEKIEDLYSDVPEEVIFTRDYEIPASMSEIELRNHFKELGEKNKNLVIFAGGGVYDHYAPSVINHLLSRSEFYTAYTPYQPEISQGTLQYIFEYQSMICELTGLDVSNASMYDGATAAAESMFMAVASSKKRNRVLISATIADHIRKVVATYCKFHGIELTVIPEKDGVTDLDKVKQEISTDTIAGVMVPTPNKYGIIEDYTGLSDFIHDHKSFLINYCDPSTLAVLKTPAEWGADIACGDGQSLGMPMNFGGPYLGFIACSKSMIRKLPGRVVGATKDADGKRAFVLTLQAREQHIRREKATSNICSNQSLMALYATIYLSLMGKEGLKEVNVLSCDGAHYLYEKLLASGKFHAAFDRPFLKEFVVTTDLDMEKINKKLLDNNIQGGILLGDGKVEFAVTEQRTKEEIDKLVELITKE